MSRETHAGFWESAGGRFPCATRPSVFSVLLTENRVDFDNKAHRLCPELSAQWSNDKESYK